MRNTFCEIMKNVYLRKNFSCMNPFILSPHTPEPYFCDRHKETETIIRYLDNGSNLTLISPRRYGKTGLIYHVFDVLHSQGKNYETYYADIYPSRNIEDFIALIAEAIYGRLEGPASVKALFEKLKAVRPVLSQDPVTGTPQLSFSFQSENEKRHTLKTLFDYLEHRKKKVIFAIDEFQQIRQYEGISAEALLRAYIQPLKNVRFIFSGSRRHIMADMFTGEKSPFYESAAAYPIDRIPAETYATFIHEMFEKEGRKISGEAVDFILEWTFRHTYYTQFLCNRVFQLTRKEATMTEVFQAIDDILKENTDLFLERRNLLTRKQWDFLIAVAKEKEVVQPTSATFLRKYGLGAPSSAVRLLQALVEKELLLENKSLSGSSFRVYNVFFSRWLERL